MCGACSTGEVVSFQPSDIVEVRESKGESIVHGYILEKDNAWGVRVVWQDSTWTWYEYGKWCPLSWESGFSMRLASGDVDKSAFDAAIAYAAAQTEIGRSWLLRPPAKVARARREMLSPHKPITNSAVPLDASVTAAVADNQNKAGNADLDATRVVQTAPISSECTMCEVFLAGECSTPRLEGGSQPSGSQGATCVEASVDLSW